jgi:hypothetical protein
LVHSMDTTLKRVSSEWNTGDLMSVYGIITLIGIIIAAPIVVRYVWIFIWLFHLEGSSF